MQRNRFIDVLKGILIICVVFYHFPMVEEGRLGFLYPFRNLVIPSFMFITGYVYALSFQRRNIDSFQKAYGSRMIIEQIIRYVSPFTMAFVAEWILLRILGIFSVNIFTYGPLAFCFDYLRGGVGMGNYYVPVMLQGVVLFPVIYLLIRKYQFRGLVYCFLGNAGFEILKSAYYMNEGEYRLIFFRYLFIIAAGCYVALGNTLDQKKTMTVSMVCLLIGGFFFYLFAFTNYVPKIIVFWSATSFLPCLLIVPILGVLITRVRLHCYPLELMGKASFNIFLVQMIFYLLAGRIYPLLPEWCPQLLFSILACVGLGILFYFIETPITKFLIKTGRKYGSKEKG